jgi:hypothetical protein
MWVYAELPVKSLNNPHLKSETNELHAVVIGPAPAFRRDPGDDLVGIHDVAGLAVYAVSEVDM